MSILFETTPLAAHVVLLLRDATVAVNIQHLKYKTIARHYVEFTLGDLSIAVADKDSKAGAPLRLRQLAITVLVQQFERRATNSVDVETLRNACTSLSTVSSFPDGGAVAAHRSSLGGVLSCIA